MDVEDVVVKAIGDAAARPEEWVSVGDDGHAVKAQALPNGILVFMMCLPGSGRARVVPFGVYR